jgi:hypothetical protein
MISQPPTRASQRLLIYTLAAVVGILLALLVTQLFLAESPTIQERSPSSATSSNNPSPSVMAEGESGSLPARPQSIKDFVNQSDIIVVGTVGRIVREGSFYGYDANGNMLMSDPHPSAPFPVSRATTFVDYEINVEQVIKDDGMLQAGKPLILRMPGKPSAEIAQNPEYPMSQPGDHHLMGLTRTPDHQAYGFYYGPWGRLDIGGPVITYTDGDHTPIDFTEHRNPAEFIQALRAVVRQK